MPKITIKGKKPGAGFSINTAKPKGIKSLVKQRGKIATPQRLAGVRS